MSPRPPRLYAVDGIRVIAEYLVVRFHVLHNTCNGDWYAGVDLMSLFFVLSGFSMMYAYEQEDFSSWGKIAQFWRRKLVPAYAIFWLNCVFWLPYAISQARLAPGCPRCVACPLLQLGWLDSWVGCAWEGIMNYPSWYFSCQVWFWIAFPLVRNTLVEALGKTQSVWPRLGVMHMLSVVVFLAAWRWPMPMTIGFPPARFAEFVIGCGTALALHKPLSPLMAKGRHWYILAGLVVPYIACMLNTTMTSFCLREAHLNNCTLWGEDRPRLGPPTAPCNVWVDKIHSKSALAWAAFVHCVARAELDGTGGWPVQALSSSLFRTLSGFSLVLYLGHVNMSMLFSWLGHFLLGVEEDDWADDTRLLWVYVLCYCLHCLLLKASQRWQQEPIQPPCQETEMLVLNSIEPCDTELQDTNAQAEEA